MSTSILHLFFFTCFLLLKMHYLDHILEYPIGPSLKVVQLRVLFDWTNMAAALPQFFGAARHPWFEVFWGQWLEHPQDLELLIKACCSHILMWFPCFWPRVEGVHPTYLNVPTKVKYDLQGTSICPMLNWETNSFIPGGSYPAISKEVERSTTIPGISDHDSIPLKIISSKPKIMKKPPHKRYLYNKS